MVNDTRKLAISCIEEFEDLLDRKDITIPSDDREGNEEEARLYGCEYYQVEDAVTEILTKRFDNLKKDLLQLCTLKDVDITKEIKLYFKHLKEKH